MKLVRIKEMSSNGHLLYMSLCGTVCGFIYGIILLIVLVLNMMNATSKIFLVGAGMILGSTISGAIVGLIAGLVSYKLINLILRRDYFKVEAYVEE